MKMEVRFVGRLAARMWIYTEAVIRNGQNHIEGFRNQKKNSIMEAITCFCARIQHNHEWISEFSLVFQKNKILALNYDVDVPCIVQWEMLWCSAPTSLNNDLLNEGIVFDGYSSVINLAMSTKIDAGVGFAWMGLKARKWDERMESW